VIGQDGRPTYRQYFPIGTVEGGRQLFVNKPDDFLFVPADKAADFLFLVDASALPDLKALPAKIPGDSEAFVEAKRYGRVPLADKTIEALGPGEQVSVLRKKQVVDAAANSNPDVLKGRLIGQWDAVENGQNVVFTFNNAGTWTAELTVGGNPVKTGGTWKVVTGGAGGLTTENTTAKGQLKKFFTTFKDADHATMTDLATKGATQLTRKK